MKPLIYLRVASTQWPRSSTTFVRSSRQGRLFSGAAVRLLIPTSSGTVDQTEVAKFSELAQDWWDESGQFAALHTMNHLRVPFISRGLTSDSKNHTSPLAGLSLLDVGCGGGILSEPLARLGAHVTGLDASERNIKVAQQREVAGCRYRWGAVEEEGDVYDCVVASEILEHVARPAHFISACSALLSSGGSLFLTSLNQTWQSRLLAIYAAERLLRIVPRGAHDWTKFVPLDAVYSMLGQNGLGVCAVHGMRLNPLTLRWSWTSDMSMNYALHAIKS